MATTSRPLGGRLVYGKLMILVAALASCEGTRTVESECRPVYGADVCAWSKLSGDAVVEFGVTMPLESVKNAPAEGEMAWPPAPIAVLELPPEVKSATGFSHFELNWELHGHPPPAFMEPHFDFHFYTIPPEKVNAIDCADATKPSQLPADYVLPDITVPELGELVGLCVPAMGMHAMPKDEFERSEPFTASMMIGYYGGELIFVEPMAARSTLLREEDITLDVPVLPAQGDVRYPTRFKAEYDAAARVYRLVFSEFRSS